ncbi:MAG TPA: hypothetical protein VFZ58_02700 [Candidatus Saccharimonadales bacterium]
MNKKRLHYYLTVLRRLKAWQLLIIAFILTAVSIGLLRSNSVEAVRLFDAVKQADREGKDVYGALNVLQKYVATHMNTQLERVSLEKTFERDYQVALDKLVSSGSIYDDQYDEAQMACRGQSSISYVIYAKCVEQKLAQVAPGQDPIVKTSMPNADLYQYTFMSPTWSFDLAGVSVALTVVMYLVIVCKLGLQLTIFLIIRHHHLA